MRWLLISGGLVWLGFGTMAAWSQFSPGPLSNAHRSMNGPTQCTSCHMGGGNRRFRCLYCHTEIRQRLEARHGLHATFSAAEQRDSGCYRCHSEHNGTDFVPIRWDVNIEEFDHRKTGYPLEGAHAALGCRRCHNARHISPEARSNIRVKDLGFTFLGLNRDCLGCHEDEHAGQLGTACERCHTLVRWTDVGRFDHAKAKFILTGAHRQVACQKCHPSLRVAGLAKPRIRLVGIPFGKCNDCHQDPHRGSFLAACTSCHTDLAWKPTIASFDHANTKFPLLGKHVGVACGKCHRTADFSASLTSQCQGCHKDYHGGQFANRADRGECGVCHTVDGWKPATFTVASHAATDYPLTGRHAAVACAGCHKPAGAQTVYRLRHDACTDCHADQHEGQFTAAYQNRCDACHTTEDYQPATFTLARHNQTRFPLAGSHLAVACEECHKKPAQHKAGIYHFADLSCAACHTDPHQPQQPERSTVANAGSSPRCESCHSVGAWTETARFDHSTTQFALTGAHRAVACAHCHHPAALSASVAKIVFVGTPSTCAGCHQDIHGGQFASKTGIPSCDVCHSTDRWKPSRFDHERTSFPLTGAHAGVACSECHKTTREVKDQMVLFYKPTPQDCGSCHGPQS